MRYGIFSDIHANLEALESVIAALRQESIDRFWCPGDVVGYGANPQECVERVKELPATTIAGNHDWAVLGKANLEYFNPLAKAAVCWTQEHIDKEGLKFLKNLPLVFEDEEAMMVHGALPHPENFEYLTTVSAAREMFPLFQRNVCFIGHTHVPFIIKNHNGELAVEKDLKIKIEPDCQYIINVGSVGQPRDGNPQAAYCIFDSKLKTLAIERVEYDMATAQKKIIDAGLPGPLAQRLSMGR
jgi:predicted phosphodiesterase